MANKRMFSREITASDAFLDMPSSSQALYFHLGMEADDDGFIGNPKKVMRALGASADDMSILISRRFVLPFPSGVVVVKHHRINNNWDKHNCKRTVYLEEFSQLNIKENKAYTLDKSQGSPVQTENRLKTVFRIEENRIDNTAANAAEITIVPEEERPVRPSKAKYPHFEEIANLFPERQKSWEAMKNVQEREYAEYLYERGIGKVKSIVAFCLKHEKDEFFPSWKSPSLLEKNWIKIQDFAERNGL